MSRPLGSVFFGTNPKNLLQFNYIEIDSSAVGATHSLMIRDYHSIYCRFSRSRSFLQPMLLSQ